MSVNNPTMVEVMSRVLDQHGSQIAVCKPGIVESFDRTTRTARVSSATLKQDGTSRAVTVSTPVIFPLVNWHVQDGEKGILVISDEDWRTWWRTGEVSVPESQGVHELSSSFFVPGLMSLPDTVTAGAIPSNRTVIPIPVAGGRVLIGSSTAAQALVLGNAWATFMNNGALPAAGPSTVGFLKALWDWATSINAVVVGLGGAPVGLAALLNEIQVYNEGVTPPGAAFISDVVRTD